MTDVKHNAEKLREKMWRPGQRQRALQETLLWAEAQKTAVRATPKSCLTRERKLLASLKSTDTQDSGQ